MYSPQLNKTVLASLLILARGGKGRGEGGRGKAVANQVYQTKAAVAAGMVSVPFPSLFPLSITKAFKGPRKALARLPERAVKPRYHYHHLDLAHVEMSGDSI